MTDSPASPAAPAATAPTAAVARLQVIALDCADPDELACPKTGLAYSLDQEHYSPRCRSCHAKYDGIGFSLHAG